MNIRCWQFRSLVGASTIAVTAAVALGATGAASDVFAARAKPGPSSAVAASQTNAPTVEPASTVVKKQTPLSTTIESGFALQPLSANTDTALDPVNKLTCPTSETCTITDTISVELNSDSGDYGNYFSAPWQIDGHYTGQEGPFMGSVPQDGTYIGGTWTDTESDIGAGKHTVQSFVYSQFERGTLFLDGDLQYLRLSRTSRDRR